MAHQKNYNKNLWEKKITSQKDWVFLIPPLLFRVLGYLQKEYGMMLAISQGYLIIHNFCVIIVACALDLTFKFNWVLDIEWGKV